MEYIKAYTFFARKPKTGLTNLMFGALCAFSQGIVPFIGLIVWLGYRSYAASDLEEDPDLEYHRDFTFDKFADYLGRGVWQFLIQLVVGGVAGCIAVGAVLAGVFAVSQSDPNLIPLAALAGYLVYAVVIVLATLLMWPLELYAALSEEFSVGRACSFAGRFARLMWGEMLVAIIVYFLLTTLVMLVGVLLCCVGSLPAFAIVSMAEVHILVQLYRRYLDKGGEAIRELNKIHDLADEE